MQELDDISGRLYNRECIGSSWLVVKNLITGAAHYVSEVTALFGQQLSSRRDVVNQHLEVHVFNRRFAKPLPAVSGRSRD